MLGILSALLLGYGIQNIWTDNDLKAFYGGDSRTIFYDDKEISVYTIPVEDTKKEQAEIKAHLLKYNIPLTSNPKEPTSRGLKFDDRLLKIWEFVLEQGHGKHAVEFYQKYLKALRHNYRTFPQLMKGLKICCRKVNGLLKNGDYLLGCHPKKSSQWVASLALPYLKYLPNYFTGISKGGVLESTDKISKEESLPYRFPADVDTLVIFEDILYSGSQMTTVLREMHEQKLLIGKTVYVVAPISSSAARSTIDKFCTINSISYKLITDPSLNIQTFGEVFGKDAELWMSFCYDHDLTVVYPERWQTFTLCDWKQPDNYSVVYPKYKVPAKEHNPPDLELKVSPLLEQYDKLRNVESTDTKALSELERSVRSIYAFLPTKTDEPYKAD
jgi:hypothetical protein